MIETQKFQTRIGGKKVGVEFKRAGSDYSVRAWGLSFEELVKYQSEYYLWLDTCLSKFSEVLDRRLDMTTRVSAVKPFVHIELKELDPDRAREMDLNARSIGITVVTAGLNEEEKQALLRRMKERGGEAQIADGSIIPVEKIGSLSSED
jgi:hypothetical protein